MTKDGAGCRPGADTGSRRSDFPKALAAVGLTAAVVIAFVGPASRDLRPSTLLEDVVAVSAAVRSVDEAPPKITTSVRRDQRTTIAGDAFELGNAPSADGPASSCVPCVTADRSAAQPRSAARNPRAAAAVARPTDRPASPKVEDGPASSTTTEVLATPDNRAAEPPRPEKHSATKAAPEPAMSGPAPAPGNSADAPGRPVDHADGSTPSDDDRPGNGPHRSDDQKAKAKQ